MKAVAVILGLVVAFLVGGYVEYGFGQPFAALWPKPVPMPGVPTTASQSANTARVTADTNSCYGTMMARGLTSADARDTCQKIMSGITR